MKFELIQSFSRTIGRKLSKTQQSLIRGNLEKYLVTDVEEIKDFISEKEVWFEIGFGSGEHIANIAHINPNINFIGCEVFLNGIANLIKEIDDKNINNIKIWQADARILLKSLPDNILSRIYILFPDPWPKFKHHKRRIISDETLNLLAQKLKKDSKLFIATDHLDYKNHIEKACYANDKFNLISKDLQIEPENWIKTRYQLKAENQGLKPYFFILKKI